MQSKSLPSRHESGKIWKGSVSRGDKNDVTSPSYKLFHDCGDPEIKNIALPMQKHRLVLK